MAWQKKYDYIIVGAGLYGATAAQVLTENGKKCLVLEKRDHIGGNCYTEEIHGIHLHKYGPHIFHTNDKFIWDYINRFGKFNGYINSPLALSGGKLYNLPFNMNTFYQLWGCKTPAEARAKIDQQKGKHYVENPKNLEEQALNLVGEDIFNTLIKSYTEKQWGRKCSELNPDIIKRLPIRYTFDNNYFNAVYQGIPIGGYTRLMENMLSGVEVKVGVDYLENKGIWDNLGENIIYTGAIDEYFGYSLGSLQYRTVSFEQELINEENYQGNAVINYIDKDIPYTRIIEHKHFDNTGSKKTIISREYSLEWDIDKEPYYPIIDAKSSNLYGKYLKLAKNLKNLTFGGRLGEYKYYDMDQVILSAYKKFGNLKAIVQ